MSAPVTAEAALRFAVQLAAELGLIWPAPELPRLFDGFDLLVDRRPVVSDGFASTRVVNGRRIPHGGADVDYHRRTLQDLVKLFAGKTQFSTLRHFMPGEHVPCVAAMAGRIWSAGVEDFGGSIVLDHGTYGPVCTFYAHMDGESVLAQRFRRGQPIERGQFLGWISGSTRGSRGDKRKVGFRHVHFEWWDFETRGVRLKIDPAPLLDRKAKWLELADVIGAP